MNDALSRIHAIVEQKKSHILHTGDISRADRELLLHNRWLEEIIRGWYLVIRPDLPPGDSTAWYANFWDFLKAYLLHHYDSEYCLSAECSLDFHLGNTTIPKQIIVMAPKGSGAPLQLPYGTSLLVYADPTRLPEEREVVRGLQVMPFAYAICKVSPTYFQASPQEAQIALRAMHNPAELLRTIVKHNFKSAAGRLIGAYRFIGNTVIADTLKSNLEEVGIAVIEKNPFVNETPIVKESQLTSPIAMRIHAMWGQFRNVVISHFPPVSGLPANSRAYLDHITEMYAQDAYNSLSIEGYQVTRELIEKVKRAEWLPEQNPTDQQQRDALAARGYYEAFLSVKESVEKILNREPPSQVITQDLPRWYQKLFAPSVQAGILSASDLFGYRRHQVYIRHSRHTPPAKEYLVDAMEALFQCLQEEEHAAVRAVLGHFFFVYIHPYMDGNGRIGRFLMNAMLASGGYPWTVIQVTHRNQYFASLELASVAADILPFTQFIASQLHSSSRRI